MRFRSHEIHFFLNLGHSEFHTAQLLFVVETFAVLTPCDDFHFVPIVVRLSEHRDNRCGQGGDRQRVALMVAAAQDPLSGDHADVLRMLASREALSEAGFGLVEDVGGWVEHDVGAYLSYVSRALTAAVAIFE